MGFIEAFLLNFKWVVSLFVAVISFVIFLILCKKYKLSKYQILVFALFVLFWMSIIVVRSYRKIYMLSDVSLGGLGFEENFAVSVVAIYGLISIIVRMPIFILSDFFKSRKFFIMLSLFFIGLSSLIVYLNPTYITMFCSSLSIGIGASFISMFNVIFAETFSKENAIKSVSILSIAPLFGEFLSAPIQYLFTNETIKNYSGLWLMSFILAIIAFIACIFFKDNKTKVRNFSFKKMSFVIKNKNFLIICLLGIVVSFIKFASSGANFLALVKLEQINMSPLGLAYSDVIFSSLQLIGGVLMGIYLKNKIGVKKSLILGFISILLFLIVPLITDNSILLFLSYAFNGFGYGITYNILIGLALDPFENNFREVSMSIFQTFFAIGIYFGDKIYAFVFNTLKNSNILVTYHRVFFIVLILTILTLLIISIFYKEKKVSKSID